MENNHVTQELYKMYDNINTINREISLIQGFNCDDKPISAYNWNMFCSTDFVSKNMKTSLNTRCFSYVNECIL